VLVFLGASYFRALGKDQRYGLSARGLAVDTALASGEEFPVFTEFWLEKPAPGAKELTIYGLLDSKSMSGAYRFILRPGTDTAIDVKARIFARRNIAKLGVAPLTSMYLFGENQRSPTEDYRPEVHDSDGLSIASGTGEWIWRPLSNPKRLLVTSFGLNNPIGFGLLQRDRNFASYEDLEARYEMRPSAWIRPLKPFGAGRVELVQIPSPFESNDNIVAFWSPREPPQARQHLDLDYQILWLRLSPMRAPSSSVVQTRRGPGFTRRPEATVDFHIDFEGPMLRKLPEKAEVTPVFTPDANGEIVEVAHQRNPLNSGVRVSLRVKRLDATKPVELRGFLRNEGETLSETWSYILPPE
jgi:glucans biosynthesis protein